MGGHSPDTVTTGTAYNGLTYGATHQTGEPVIDPTGNASIWLSWSPATTGSYSITTYGSTFNTILGVFRRTAALSSGHPFDNLVPVANSSSCFGQTLACVSQNFNGSTVYAIVVDGSQNSVGYLTLMITGDTPMNDAFSQYVGRGVVVLVPMDTAWQSRSFDASSSRYHQSIAKSLGPCDSGAPC